MSKKNEMKKSHHDKRAAVTGDHDDGWMMLSNDGNELVGNLYSGMALARSPAKTPRGNHKAYICKCVEI
jgi:hypothetical protein